MKILLINPPWRLANNSVYSKTGAIYPPLGLAAIAATARQLPGCEVKVVDAYGLGIGIEEYTEILREENPQVIGITAYTATWQQALHAAKVAKQELPDTTIVMGGPHPTNLPEEVAARDCVDFVIRGEGEHAFLSLLKQLQKTKPDFSSVEGLCYQTDDRIHLSDNVGYVDDLDALPPVNRHELPMHIYRPAAGAYKRQPVTSMITSRGCPFKCTFCSKAIFGSSVRFRSVENVMEELEGLISDFGIKEIYFADDCFTLNRKRATRICEEIIHRKLDLTWSCSTRANLVDRELLQLMKSAGCISIGFGVETGNPEMAITIKKGITLEDAKTAVTLAREVGMDTRTSYIFGLPFETNKNMYQTLRASMALDSDFVIFNLAVPLPGTELYRVAKENNLLLYEGEDLYAMTDGATVTIRPAEMTPGQLRKFYKDAYRLYYLRPTYIWKRLKRIRSKTDLINNLKGLKEFLSWQNSTES